MKNPLITELAINQVFVFGSNNSGFHGAGAAGFAFSGTAVNDWRICPKKRLAREAHARFGNQPWPLASVDPRVGTWAVWGRAEGHQHGLKGQSYAIRTVVTPGGPAVALYEIESQLLQLFKYAAGHPELEFLMTAVGCGRAGHHPSELSEMMDRLIRIHGLPANIIHAETVYSSAL